MIVYTCVSDQRGLEIILYMYGSRTFSTSTTIVRDGYTKKVLRKNNLQLAVKI
jgi:hypothetical protein